MSDLEIFFQNLARAIMHKWDPHVQVFHDKEGHIRKVQYRYDRLWADPYIVSVSIHRPLYPGMQGSLELVVGDDVWYFLDTGAGVSRVGSKCLPDWAGEAVLPTSQNKRDLVR